jgi:hypothetical protein
MQLKTKLSAGLMGLGLLFGAIATSSVASASTHSNASGAAGVKVTRVSPFAPPISDFSETFGAATSTLTFTVSGPVGSPVKVSTEDCCIAGDQWGITVFQAPRSVATSGVSSKCGTGDTGSFTGGAGKTIPSGGVVKIVVYYCNGVDIFPAGMTVRIQTFGSITQTS